MQDGYLCTGCTRDLARTLVLAASIAPDLDDAVARQLRRGSGRASAEVPLPFDPAASEAAKALRHQLWSTGVAVSPDACVPYDIRDAAEWLMSRLDVIRQRQNAAHIHRTITADVNRAAAVVDRKPERAPAGQCTACGAELLAELGADTVQCGCGQVKIGLIADRLNRVQKADVLGTPGEIHGALKAIGIDVPRGTITSWASRGRLLPRPGGAYALSDVLALKAQSDQRRP